MSRTPSGAGQDDHTAGHPRVPVSPTDVVTGRGRFIFNSPGNERYERLLDHYAEHHIKAGGSMTTTDIQDAMTEMLNERSRIMCSYCKHTKTACVMPVKLFRTKIGQAVRYRISQRKKGRHARSSSTHHRIHPEASATDQERLPKRSPIKLDVVEAIGSHRERLHLFNSTVHEAVVGSRRPPKESRAPPIDRHAVKTRFRNGFDISDREKAVLGFDDRAGSVFPSWTPDLQQSIMSRPHQSEELQGLFPDPTLAQQLQSDTYISKTRDSPRNLQGNGGTAPELVKDEWVIDSEDLLVEPIPFEEAMFNHPNQTTESERANFTSMTLK